MFFYVYYLFFVNYFLQPYLISFFQYCPTALNACGCFPEKATKVKISLVKGHGLVMMQQLQAGAEKVFQAMHKWLEANYHAEIKRLNVFYFSVYLC